jgi:hypothetical protein
MTTQKELWASKLQLSRLRATVLCSELTPAKLFNLPRQEKPLLFFFPLCQEVSRQKSPKSSKPPNPKSKPHRPKFSNKTSLPVRWCKDPPSPRSKPKKRELLSKIFSLCLKSTKFSKFQPCALRQINRRFSRTTKFSTSLRNRPNSRKRDHLLIWLAEGSPRSRRKFPRPIYINLSLPWASSLTPQMCRPPQAQQLKPEPRSASNNSRSRTRRGHGITREASWQTKSKIDWRAVCCHRVHSHRAMDSSLQSPFWSQGPKSYTRDQSKNCAQ